MIFDLVPAHWQRGPVMESIAAAAAELGTMAVIAAGDDRPWEEAAHGHIIPLLDAEDHKSIGLIGPMSPIRPMAAPLVMVHDHADVMKFQATLKAQNPGRIVAVRLPATPVAAQRVLELARQGAEVIHLVFDAHGRETGAESPRHMRDVLREVHTTLVKAGVRDEITLVASGGIALAEHLAKAIICGADLVAIDIPLILALECRLCNECQKENACPVTLEEIGRDFAVHRIVNLMGAWHSQLLEVLGAMGIREVRRLRGETGRCMFFEDLERDTFGKLFGKRKERV